METVPCPNCFHPLPAQVEVDSAGKSKLAGRRPCPECEVPTFFAMPSHALKMIRRILYWILLPLAVAAAAWRVFT